MCRFAGKHYAALRSPIPVCELRRGSDSQFIEPKNIFTGSPSDIFVGFVFGHYKHVSQQVSYRLYEVIKLFTLTLNLSCF